MKLNIEIDMDNAAFDPDNGQESARILSGLAEKIASYRLLHDEGGPLVDANGNRVGAWAVEE
jgi:hypothetical protein